MLDTLQRTETMAAGAMRIGYARVSTNDQTLAAQLDALRAAGCGEVYSEKESGKREDRAELTNALRALRAGDTLVVTRLDRLGRSLPHLIKTVAELGRRGIGFESLADRIDTTTAGGELIFHVFASIAQFERRLISERTAEGLAAARARGRNGGRRASLTPSQLRQAKALLDNPDVTSRDVAATFGVSRSTLYASLKRLEKDGKEKGRVPVERR
ncbi:recombinase family protein [Sphingomonas sp. ABOLF]|nr:recombinase family protein [Sphingomonas sp. ABOLF]